MPPITGTKTNGTKINNIAPALLDLAVDIDLLNFDPENARLHPEGNMSAIKQSLTKYSQVKPVVVRAATNVVVAGNGTLQAAKELGWTKIAATFVEMSAIDAAGYGLADNRTAELAKWNHEVVSRLENLMREQNEEIIGWTDKEIQTLRLMTRPEVAVDQSQDLEEKFSVIVECQSEKAQEELLEKLMLEGHTCRALTF